MFIRPKFIFVPVILGALLILGLSAFGYREYRRYQRAQEAKKIVQAKTVKVTFIEGWTLDEIGAALEKQGLLGKDKFKAELKKFDPAAFPLVKASKPKNASYEGYLFPDTYFFTEVSTPEEIIGKILENFEARGISAGLSADRPAYTNGLNLYETLILASIVEMESGGQNVTQAELNDQRATIAGIFYNRLAKGQGLESDATVNYVTGKNRAAASAQDIQVDSPYNTYKYRGLPPGPISNPSLSSIKAVLNPKKTDFYYFLHAQPSGQVYYSRTFEEHVQKKRQYLN